ncbi:putative receptor-like protein kinase [Carex littledalei]|uniref:Putative receptor-like protein kinase n=1 Tax=Carex littledalei TaxID=544730 RepID=A0A833RCT3_9POAL|nr:putative receptor-like protein kinase [Carex littledalei]
MCGVGSPEIRYPFRLSTQPSYCGAPGMELFCSGNETLLEHQNAGRCKVLFVDYVNSEITVELGDAFSLCPINNLTSINLTTENFRPYRMIEMDILSCPKDKVNQSDIVFSNTIFAPLSCLSNSTQLTYMVFGIYEISSLPSFCVVLYNNLSIPDIDELHNGWIFDDYSDLWKGMVRLKHFNVTLIYYVPGVTDECKICEAEGKQCAATKSFCTHKSRNGKLIGATSATGLVVLVLLITLLWYVSRKCSHHDYSQHEKLLAKYGNKLTRYSFLEIKKITKRFRDKLGQGGYGSVFKGELLNGIHVAVKILERSNTDSNGKDFINEVATIGTIHHFNVVRLLGFCSEGSRHALIYEFMPNGSLDKYISNKTENNASRALHMETFLKIATGVANGIKYLHEGCNHRILHFDIKPHNILLDHNLNPKISDFGLAKLCSDDKSNVTITAAKGTIGYMAPEVYSRNFGTVSYKSDVYSFGMLILKMVLDEKNLQPNLQTDREVYFPEFIYEKLARGEDLDSAIAFISTTEADIAKKLIIVAFWCIQWNPVERPHMTRVVQMLASDLQNLEIPLKPFAS